MFVRRALLSVSDKTGLVEFARALEAQGVELIATAGTAASLAASGIAVKPVAELTNSPDAFLGGRVKTLQPALYAGLLADRENREHLRDLERQGFHPIDLLCLNLYPFGGTDQDDTTPQSAITHIDIGGPMLLRAGALNYRHVAVVTRHVQYDEVLRLLRRNQNQLPEDLLARLATQAFALVASYEAQVSAWFAEHYSEPRDRVPTETARINWTRCRMCAGATASERVDLCLRHLEPADRRRELQLLEGAIDLRNVHVGGTLFAEILSAVAGLDGRPRLASLRCDLTQFEGAISLEAAIVQGDLDFSGARFTGSLNCSDIVVLGECRCRDTRFRIASFDHARIDGLATFRGADFRQVSFDEAQFVGPAVFEQADFASTASFTGTLFHRDVTFIGASFHGDAVFRRAQWYQDTRFRDATFARAPDTADLARFREASWPVESQTPPDEGTRRTSGGRAKVFIGSSRESLDVARAIQQNLDYEAEATLWTQGVFEVGGVASISLRSALGEFDFAVFVMAADDVATSRGTSSPAPRDNILWESGLSAGVLGPERTFLVKPLSIDVRLPTDLDGVNTASYDAGRTNLQAATGAACTAILSVMRKAGRREWDSI